MTFSEFKSQANEFFNSSEFAAFWEKSDNQEQMMAEFFEDTGMAWTRKNEDFFRAMNEENA